jgi:hypothetical protein
VDELWTPERIDPTHITILVAPIITKYFVIKCSKIDINKTIAFRVLLFVSPYAVVLVGPATAILTSDTAFTDHKGVHVSSIGCWQPLALNTELNYYSLRLEI